MFPMPHTITHEPKVANQGANKVKKTPSYGDAVEMKAMVQPTNPTAVFAVTGVVMNRPHNVYLSVANGEGMKVGDRITYESQEYVVSAPVRVWRGVGIDYAIVTIADKDGDE
ncbi:MAG: hypothetical protein BGO01_03670 [Armatimonadetes bacterium 55-13]|nr:MAG: hypothetical protein BGO01_03670 [Armatimonadetes bacterium 55-13]